MKAARFEYRRASSVADAIHLLEQGGTGAKLMAGSQSLGPMLNLRLARPSRVVDVSALPELRSVREDANWIYIGAAVTHAEIEDGIHPPLRGTLLPKVAGGIAFRSIRNRGTLGGSLAHADPAADWVLVAAALGAQVEIVAAAGTRSVLMDDFMLGAYTTVLRDGEIISSIRFPKLGEQGRWGYFKLCRKTGEFAEASCAAVFDSQRKLARVVLGALDGAPRALPEIATEVARTGRRPAAAVIDSAVVRASGSDDAVNRKLRTAAVARCLDQVCGVG